MGQRRQTTAVIQSARPVAAGLSPPLLLLLLPLLLLGQPPQVPLLRGPVRKYRPHHTICESCHCALECCGVGARHSRSPRLLRPRVLAMLLDELAIAALAMFQPKTASEVDVLLLTWRGLAVLLGPGAKPHHCGPDMLAGRPSHRCDQERSVHPGSDAKPLPIHPWGLQLDVEPELFPIQCQKLTAPHPFAPRSHGLQRLQLSHPPVCRLSEKCPEGRSAVLLCGTPVLATPASPFELPLLLLPLRAQARVGRCMFGC
mmetsp:Transcript_46204/g.91574  ORF Transcript_46204/g.91574 Transcript_46204/m.91574 type:complete len:258 (+) Transcript_46204:157-930(+)